VIRSSGLNPLPYQTVPGAATLSIEFSVSATASAVYGATYSLRLTDGGVALPGVAMQF
jgi:hypothetical protein